MSDKEKTKGATCGGQVPGNKYVKAAEIFHAGKAQKQNDSRLHPGCQFGVEKEMGHKPYPEHGQKKPQGAKLADFFQEGEGDDGLPAQQAGQGLYKCGVAEYKHAARKRIGNQQASCIDSQFFF